MKLGDVLKKERERKKLSIEEMAGRLGISEERYREVEEGRSEAERWGPVLRQTAVSLATPTSRLLAESGKSADTKPGQAGELIRRHRERQSKTAEQLAGEIGVSPEEYREVEEGRSPLEVVGPLLLRFAEVIEQPVFNLLHPAGLPYEKLNPEDYP